MMLESVLPSQLIFGQLAVGGKLNDGNRLRELALDNIVVNSDLVDVTEATVSKPHIRGCTACALACGDRKCGPYGVCRNPWTATESFTCTCRVGYQPELQNGTPTLVFANAILTIPGVNGSDGDWHHYRVSITTRDVRFEVPSVGNIGGQQYPLGKVDRSSLLGLQPGCPNADLCQPLNPCEGNQLCIPEWQSYRCVCPDGLELMSAPDGVQCVQTTCDPNPCRNLGICRPSDTLITIDNISLAVACSCPTGWTGALCELSVPMQNIHMAWWSLPAAFIVLILGYVPPYGRHFVGFGGKNDDLTVARREMPNLPGSSANRR
ncbi:unnamed protein product [Dibothriocephalus latus]|uniref:EGF-like domain-containing protein n=1 Tax=Dibothriocephalus latus TaxID=60516 RepID=A0A3P6ULZ5_DIBLA|nr:unnamed protein product [Dibothriocephalus latus]